MAIKLIKLTKQYQSQLKEMIDEWKEDQIKNHTDGSPWVIFKNSYEDFDYYLNNLETKDYSGGFVPDSVFFLYDEQRDRLLGAVNIRHELNEHLYKCGGHIGDGVRPSERRKGYATLMISLAIEECLKLGINQILVCCNKDNIGSRKSITANGGILENEIEDEDGSVVQRYWINAAREVLKKHINDIHTTKLGEIRIQKNTGISYPKVLEIIKNCIDSKDTLISKKGKNIYFLRDGLEVCINASSYTIISAHNID